jgi:hypothetical protein
MRTRALLSASLNGTARLRETAAHDARMPARSSVLTFAAPMFVHLFEAIAK